MATIRTGGFGHELTPYLPSSRSSSPDPLPSLGCYAHQQPSRHQIQHQRHCRGQSGKLKQAETRLMGKVAQAFVIAACSVVIVVGGTWLYEKYLTQSKYDDCIDRNVAIFNSQLPGKQANWNTLTSNEKRAYWRKPCAEDPSYKYSY